MLSSFLPSPISLTAAALLLMGNVSPAAQGDWVTTRTSIASSGVEANSASRVSSISADGRYVAFESFASNLVPGDTNNAADIFLLDRQTGIVALVDVAIGGGPGDQGASAPEISDDGAWIGFVSSSTDLVSGDTNGRMDVFLASVATGAIQRVSLTAAGGETNGDSTYFALSGDGNAIAFLSFANDVVSSDTNGMPDVFVRDRLSGTTTRVSLASSGAQGNFLCGLVAISADGSKVAFESSSDNLVSGDTNGTQDIFVHDRVFGTTTRVSVGTGGVEANGWSSEPALSGDGNVVAWVTDSTNLDPADTNWYRDVYTRDLLTSVTTVSSVSSNGTVGNDESGTPDLSQDGSYLVFWSRASNLSSGPANVLKDVFFRDRNVGLTIQLSRDSFGRPGAHHSWNPRISPDGRWIPFTSTASNLVVGDNNYFDDTFLSERTLSEGIMQRGMPITMSVTSSRPGETVFFTYSAHGVGAGPCIPALGYMCLDLLNPVTIVGTAVSDASGNASLTATIPAGAPLIPIATQAVIMRGTAGADSVLSNPLLQTIQP